MLARTTCATSLLDLSGVLEPLLILRRLLPPLVGRAGADQVHVGTEVLLVLPGAVAGAVGAQAEVVRRQLLRGSVRPGEDIAAPVPNLSAPAPGVVLLPEPVPLGQVLDAVVPVGAVVSPGGEGRPG